MKNIPFVLWMLGYPLVGSIGDYLAFLLGRRYDDSTWAWASLIEFGIWFYVGHLLYVDEK